MAGVAYLDTNVFIDAIEGTDSISQPIKALFEAARGKRGALVTSELTLAEVLASGRQERMSADLKRLYLDLIVWGGFIDLRPVSREVIYETAELRPYAPLKLPDAIHLATAVLTSCSFFLTRDQGFRRMPGSMIKIEPNADGIAQIVSRLNE